MKPTDETKRISLLLEHGVVELRCIDKSNKNKRPVIWSAWFNNLNSLIQAIKFSEYKGMDVYHTINPIEVSDDLILNTRLKPYQQTAKDINIKSRASIFFDFDPVRETGTASTEEQIEESAILAECMINFLDELGWSKPTFGYSGNGCHVVYNTDMTVEDSEKYLPDLYTALKKRFSNDSIDFDSTVRNLSRIARCLGTTNRKSDRRSSISDLSNEVTNSNIVIESSKRLTPPKVIPNHFIRDIPQPTNSKWVKGIDALNALYAKGMVIGNSKENDKYFVVCPNKGSHGDTGDTDTVLWVGEKSSFHCSHNHCQHLNITNVMEYL